MVIRRVLVLLLLLLYLQAFTQREWTYNQVDLPHNYYFKELYLPQLTSGPSWVCWSADNRELFYSMAGNLWRQGVDASEAYQLTEGPGYDYQPDLSPDGTRLVFSRYSGHALELMLLDLSSGTIDALTENGAVNAEPRWSPDGTKLAFVSTMGTGHFLLYVARINERGLSDISCITPDRESAVPRYYYSKYDHAINPVWDREGESLYYVSNKEIAHGTGDLVRHDLDRNSSTTLIRHEETSWRMRPDLSPDGTRFVYSSYLGGNWHQLWLLPRNGGYPLPLTYGDYDNFNPRWSPDGRSIAYISNRNGNTEIWTIDAYEGRQKLLRIEKLHFITPRKLLHVEVKDARDRSSARVSITDAKGRFYAPTNSWIHGDDSRYPNLQPMEQFYFHTDGFFQVLVPDQELRIVVSKGPEYEINEVSLGHDGNTSEHIDIELKRLSFPASYEGKYWSGDLHVHMNYGGHYRATPQTLARQAEAEDVNFVYNLIVNKEQRIPDVSYFSPQPDDASSGQTMIMHAQEYHTSLWGHLGLLNLTSHLLLPDYVGYPYTAVESLFPDNGWVADRAHDQDALVGYVHPFLDSDIFPQQSADLTHALPVDAALGKVDYYELVGFAHHHASAAVWYHMLNCGLRIPAGAGTDAMTNYASLRGPVGVNRVYIRKSDQLTREAVGEGIRAGNGFVTNGPLLGLTANGMGPGSVIEFSKGQELQLQIWMRSAFPVDRVDVIYNGVVIDSHLMTGQRMSFDLEKNISMDNPGWLLLRAWNHESHPDVFDCYPYASTNPIYIATEESAVRSAKSGKFFLEWVDRIEAVTSTHPAFRTESERQKILQDISAARSFYQHCVNQPTIP